METTKRDALTTGEGKVLAVEGQPQTLSQEERDAILYKAMVENDARKAIAARIH